MLRTTLAAAIIGLAGLVATPSAFADVTVNVDGNGSWYQHHRHHVALTEVSHHVQKGHVYYDGAYAYVARGNASTVVHAYPGVDVFVGAGGDVKVSVGY